MVKDIRLPLEVLLRRFHEAMVDASHDVKAHPEGLQAATLTLAQFIIDCDIHGLELSIRFAEETDEDGGA